jgi:hypothetical protein
VTNPFILPNQFKVCTYGGYQLVGSLVAHAEGLVFRSTPTGKLKVVSCYQCWSGIQACTWLSTLVARDPTSLVWYEANTSLIYMATNLVGICGKYQPCTSFIPISIPDIYLPNTSPKNTLGLNTKTRLSI